jgi:diadenosine tetraphosphate (Ap4A) HIT family hydrolase
VHSILGEAAMNCLACERIEQIKAGTNTNFIAELSESFVVLADDQGFAGWCVLHLKDHAEHLAGLPLQRQARLWDDVAIVTNAMNRALNPAPVRINYECLGNLLHHIHWHVIPRYANDAEPTKPVWGRSKEELRGSMSEARRAELVGKLRESIGAAR